MGHIGKNGSHVERWVTFRKVAHTCKNGSHSEKSVTLKI